MFKKLWAGIFFNTGGGCGRFETQLCEMYERVAESGQPDAEAVKLLDERSPEAVGDRIKVPTLLMQGQTDSLFPLGQADAAAKAIKANGAPVDVDWISGGHDGGDMETSRVQARVNSWFDRYLKDDKGADTGSAFRVTRTVGIDSADGEARLRGTTDDTYPGLESDPTQIALTGREQSFENPAGANPPAVSALPGLGAGGGLAQLSSLGLGISLDFPGQFAAFESKPVADDLQITGSPTVTVHVKSTSEDAVLFAKVYDVGPDGRSAGPARPSSSSPSASRAPSPARTCSSPSRPSTTNSTTATACAWSSPPPTSATPPRRPRRRTPSPSRATWRCPRRSAGPTVRTCCPPGSGTCRSPVP